MDAILLGAGLVAYNNLLNRAAWFNGAPFVPVNVAAAAVLIAVSTGPLGFTARAIGLDISTGGMALGALIGGMLGSALLIFGANPRTARLVADKRSAGLAGRRLAYQALVRVPLGTALLEEVAFRGILFAAAADGGTLRGAFASSISFGLWHVMPGLNMIDANRSGVPRRAKLAFAAGTVVLTTLAGLGLVALRVETGDLGAPLALHATLNSLATLAAARAGRALDLRGYVDDSRQRSQPIDQVLGADTRR